MSPPGPDPEVLWRALEASFAIPVVLFLGAATLGVLVRSLRPSLGGAEPRGPLLPVVRLVAQVSLLAAAFSLLAWHQGWVGPPRPPPGNGPIDPGPGEVRLGITAYGPAR